LKREFLLAELETVITKLETGRDFPLDVREVYVFGSFVLGKDEPEDLDLIMVHGELTTEQWNQIARGEPSPDQELDRRLKSNSQNVEIVYGPSIDAIYSRWGWKPSRAVKIWSKGDRNWKEKLAAAEPRSLEERNEILEKEIQSLRQRIRALDENILAWQKALAEVNEEYREFSPYFTRIHKTRLSLLELIRKERRVNA